MWLFPLAALVGLASAQNSTTISALSSFLNPSLTLSTTTSSATSSSFGSAITVAADGSGHFTAINAAVSAAQNNGIATVTVLPGTYVEAVTISGTATVTVVGATATAASDWTQNQVIISNPTIPFTIGTSNTKGVTLRNLDFVNSASTSASANAVVLALRGSNVAFYGCSIISQGATAVSASYGLALFANSYIEGSDKILYNVPTMYIYKSTIVALSSSASIVYSKGATQNNVFSNSTVVFDSSSIQQKLGNTNTGVFLAAPNGAGAVAVWRNTSMGSFIATAGIHSSAATMPSFYGEFATTGMGSYAMNAALRSSYDNLLTSDQVSQFTIDKIYGSAFYPYGSSSTSWIDQAVLSELTKSDLAQLAVVSVAASNASSSISMTPSSTSNSTISATISSSVATSSCVLGNASTVIVSKTPGPCEYSNVTSAINALPNDSKPYTVQINAGTYTEQLSITRKGKVTLVGATNFTNDYTQNQVRIEISNGVSTSAGQDESTPVINAKKTYDNSGLALYNIDFVNTYPQTKNTAALAADFYGANIAAYGCSFKGFQDTLLANKGTQVFSNSLIEGSIDFIWGYSTAYFHKCMIVSNTAGGFITAQARSTASATGGYIFDSCMVTYGSTYGTTFGTTYLGRPYSEQSIVVYMNSYLDKHINPAGWTVWQTSNPQTSNVLFGEYANSGPGSWQASTQRASFATNLTATQAAKYELSAWIGDTTWLDQTAYDYVPSYNLTGPSSSSTNTTNSGSTTSATVNAHPDSGNTPSTGSVVVSSDGSHSAAFTNVTAALMSLPLDATNQTIFVYPGNYNEQVSSINRPGAVRIVGYTSGTPGQSYKDNQVTISYARGLSVSPLPLGHSDAETATFATASNKISLYNINIVNTDNLDGSTSSYVTLAGSIYGNDIAFYGCSFDGWQDTLLTGATTGYQYFESCYIGGAIDFIWGYSKAYFKGCTIGAKRKSSAITAHSRASSSATGGYIFDQCLFTTALDAIDDLTNKVFLGRPYSAYALVVIKNSYLDSTISPSGWKNWSATDPRTDHITFAEFNNSGPSNWENNAAAREGFGSAILLASDTYSLSEVMDSTDWIDMTNWNSIVTPQPMNVVTVPTNTTVSGNSTYDGTMPPSGALIVSKNPIDGLITYQSIQDALNAATVSSKTNATVFIYPGVYEEQLVVNKSGTTIFRGYSNATDSYSQNQVTIQFNHGVDTQGTSGSNTDGATVYVTGNYFYAYNINFVNRFGTTKNIASLAFAVKSSKYAALYGCQIGGNQDTLSVSGYFFLFKGYVEGNVDFIYGSGSAYFLGSTISPNEDNVSIAAGKRTTNITAAGFVFDQCTLKPAPGTGPFTSIGLGRPWNNFSRVAYINCYFDSMITPAGWDQWSKSSPQTDGVVFGEYRNYGPGSNTCNRASFSQQLSDTDIVQFQLGNFFASISFIDFSRIDTQPFTVGSGSAQICASASTTMITSTESSASSSTLSFIATTNSVALPVVTAYTTTTLTVKLTASTTVTLVDITSTTFAKITSTVSITGTDVVKTSVEKATATVFITSPDVTSTSIFMVTEDHQLTIAPELITRTDVIKTTTTIVGVTTQDVLTVIVKGTMTTTAFYTATPNAATITQSEGAAVILTSTITPKESSLTSKTTISFAPSSTRTTTVKAKNSVTVSSISYKTITKKSTTTETCIPTTAARMVRRGAIIPRGVASTTTLTFSTTLTSYVKTITATQPGTTILTTKTSVARIKTISAPGSSITISLSSLVKTLTITQPGSTHSTVVTSTTTVGKTTALEASTTTVSATIYVTEEKIYTVNAPTVTMSSLKTRSMTQTVYAEQQTVVVTSSAYTTSTIRTTLPVSTHTIYQTITEGSSVATSTVTIAVETKTMISTSTRTLFAVTTRMAKGGKGC